MEAVFERNPRLEIAKKIIFGLGASTVILIINMVLSSKEFSISDLGLVLFLTGGVFLALGGLRDFFESIVIRKVRGQDLNEYANSPKSDYFYGFGVAGEDIVTGVFFLFFSFVTVLF